MPKVFIHLILMKKFDMAMLKSDIYELDVDKPKTVPKTVPSKISDVDDNVVKNTLFNKLIEKINIIGSGKKNLHKNRVPDRKIPGISKFIETKYLKRLTKLTNNASENLPPKSQIKAVLDLGDKNIIFFLDLSCFLVEKYFHDYGSQSFLKVKFKSNITFFKDFLNLYSCY